MLIILLLLYTIFQIILTPKLPMSMLEMYLINLWTGLNNK